MQCYTIFLATGHTLRARIIKISYIKVYLHNAKRFIMVFDIINCDTHKALGKYKLCYLVVQVICECKSFENILEQ